MKLLYSILAYPLVALFLLILLFLWIVSFGSYDAVKRIKQLTAKIKEQNDKEGKQS